MSAYALFFFWGGSIYANGKTPKKPGGRGPVLYSSQGEGKTRSEINGKKTLGAKENLFRLFSEHLSAKQRPMGGETEKTFDLPFSVIPTVA